MARKNSMKDEIRNYVRAHNNAVTNQEVIVYILEEREIKTNSESIRATLSKVLNETGGILKPYGIKTEIRDYLKRNNNPVTSQEVIKYILEDKKIKTTKYSIKVILDQVLEETGGTLKPYGLRAEIHKYVEAHDKIVTNQEVITYILEERKIKTTSESIRVTLRGVLKKTGGKLIRA